MKDIIILGTGGNCFDILDTINEINKHSDIYKCIGFLDDNQDLIGISNFGIEVLGPLSYAKNFNDCFFVNGIGSPYNFKNKEKIIAKTGLPENKFETIIHPNSFVSSMAKIGAGSVILQNSTIASNVKIGKHVMILSNSVINHDSSIGDYSCITSGVCVSGGVTIEESCYLGTNSSIIGNIRIGRQSLVGMGSVVLDDISPSSKIAGNPAKNISKKKSYKEK